MEQVVVIEVGDQQGKIVERFRATRFPVRIGRAYDNDLIVTDPTRLRDTMATWYYDRLVNELKVDPAEAALRAGEMSRDCRSNSTPV